MRLIAGIKAILLVSSSAFVISCASASKDVETINVSPDQYKNLNCRSLAYELAQLNQRKNTLAAALDEKASNDQGIATASGLLFWPAAFALGGNKEQEQEYARIKGEYDAVIQVGAEKQCNLNTSPALRTASLSDGATPVSATLPIEYYSQAEEEIDSKSYDKNLWSRALVEAEGDETKRKAMYIELRANQLYSENPDTTAPGWDLPPAAIELRNYIAGNTSSGKTKKGDTFHVYRSPDGTMFGRIRGTNKLNKETQDSGTWEVTRDNQYCQKWNNWSDGKWDCYQVYALEGNKYRMKAIGKSYGDIFTISEGDPEGLGKEATPIDTSTQVDISGTYASEITSNQQETFRNTGDKLVLTLKQNGDRVTATNSVHGLKIDGTRKGDIIEFFVEPNRMNWFQNQTGVWEINPDGISITGSWKMRHWGAEGKWNLRRIE